MTILMRPKSPMARRAALRGVGAAALVLLLAVPAQADRIILNRGDQEIQGTIVEETADSVVIQTTTSRFQLNKSLIKSIERDGEASADEIQGDLLFREGRLSEALQRYQSALDSGQNAEKVQAKIAQTNQALEEKASAALGEDIQRARQAADQKNFEAAIQLIRDMIDSAQDDAARGKLETELAQLHYRYARYLIDTVRINAAQKELEKAIELKSDFRDAIFELAGILINEPRTAPEARVLLVRGLALTEPPLDIERECQLRFDAARLLMDAGDFAEAIPHLNRVIEERPNSFPRAIGMLTDCYASLDDGDVDLQDSIGALSLAIERNPSALPAYYYLAQIYYKQQDYDKAAETLRSLLKLDYKYPGAHMLLGQCYRAKGDMAGYRSEVAAEAAVDPTNYDRLCDVGELLLDFDDPRQALTQFDNAIKLNEETLRAHIGRADALRRLGRYEESIKQAELVNQLRPNHPPMLRVYGLTLIDQGKYGDAMDVFSNLVAALTAEGAAQNAENDELLADSHLRLGKIAVAQNDLTRAVDEFNKALQIDDAMAEAYFDLAKAETQLNRIDSAEDIF